MNRYPAVLMTGYYWPVSGFRLMTGYSGLIYSIVPAHIRVATYLCKTFKNVSNNFDLIIGNGLVTVPNAPVGVRLFLFLYTQLIVLLGFK